MPNKKLKIEFDDKEDSWILNSNSKYVLTADNVNEIKNVVNNISLELENMNLFSSIYKYVRIVLPSEFAMNAEYICEIELSSDPAFEDRQSTVSFTSESASSRFKIFKNGQWTNIAQNGKFNGSDVQKSVKIEIIDLIETIVNPYFIRYRFKDADGIAYDWEGFVLGSFDNTAISIHRADDIVKCYIDGDASVNEESSATYSLVGVKRDGSTVDLNEGAEFSVVRTMRA